MKKLICIFITILFFFHFNLHAQHSKEKIFTLLTNGGPPDNNYKNARDIISKKWGIEYKTVVEGCLVTPVMKDSMRSYNQKVYPLIAEKYGNDWSSKFNEEVEKEQEILIQATILIRSEPFLDKLRESTTYFECWFTEKLKPNAYMVMIWGDDKEHSFSKWYQYYLLKVDLNKQRVRIINDKKTEVFN